MLPASCHTRGDPHPGNSTDQQQYCKHKQLDYAESNAEQAQDRARAAIQDASQALATAQDQAVQASTAAKEVSAQASKDADRLANLAMDEGTHKTRD